MEMETVFHGTTIIHGGTFNFYAGKPAYTQNEKNDTPEPKRKYRRFLPVISDDESD